MATSVEQAPATRRWWDLIPAIALGTIGSTALVVIGSSIGAAIHPGVDRWWFNPHLLHGWGAEVGFYAAVALLLVGWIWLGVAARAGSMSVAAAWSALVLWGTPLFLGQPLFSRDIYSYVAQSLIAKRGLNPYQVSPEVLRPSTAFSSVATVWHSTTSPYGPGFVGASKLVITMAGHGPVAQIFSLRVLELVGVVLVMICIPPLARANGVDPGCALWLSALSPLALFGFIASAHNDALMVGVMVLGILVVRRGWFAAGMAILAVAATIKLPAAAAIVFLAVDRFSQARDTRQRRRVVVSAVAVPTVVIVVINQVVGFGWGWLGPKAFKIPTELRVLTTPLIAVATFVYGVLHGIGIPLTLGGTQSAFSIAGELVSVAVMLALLARVPRGEVLRLLGIALMVLVALSPTVWPWYWLWGVAVLCVTSTQRSRALAALACVAMLVVGAGGTPLLGGWTYWLTGPLLLLGCLWLGLDGRWRRIVGAEVVGK